MTSDNKPTVGSLIRSDKIQSVCGRKFVISLSKPSIKIAAVTYSDGGDYNV